MLATLVGLSLLLALIGGTATLAGCLLARRLRVRQARRHPQQAAVREQTRQARRLAAEWPLLAQTLGLGYRNQWTRQHRFPVAEFVADDQGVTATVAAIAGAGLADYQRAAGYLADTWGCVTVRAEQQEPGLIRLRGLHRDPLLAPARIDLSGMAPASLESWWLGWAEDSQPVTIRLADGPSRSRRPATAPIRCGCAAGSSTPTPRRVRSAPCTRPSGSRMPPCSRRAATGGRRCAPRARRLIRPTASSFWPPV
jgi:hypothetical protein